MPRRRLVVGSARLLKEQSRSGFECDVIPDPFRHHPEATADADQKEYVHDAPEQPCEESRHMQPTDLRHGLGPPNGREHASVDIDKRPALARSRVMLDYVSHIAALLNGNRSQAR